MQFTTVVAVVGSAIHAPRDAKQRSLEEAMYAVANCSASFALSHVVAIRATRWPSLRRVTE